MSNPVQPDELRHPHGIAAIVERVIDEFGKSGLDGLCLQICTPLVQHMDDPSYRSAYELWIKIVCEVCAKRAIVFDAKATCERITDKLWAGAMGISLD